MIKKQNTEPRVQPTSPVLAVAHPRIFIQLLWGRPGYQELLNIPSILCFLFFNQVEFHFSLDVSFSFVLFSYLLTWVILKSISNVLCIYMQVILQFKSQANSPSPDSRLVFHSAFPAFPLLCVRGLLQLVWSK